MPKLCFLNPYGYKINRNITIIFPHVPKTAGSSVKKALEDVYGKQMYSDYDNAPVYGDEQRQSRERIIRDKISNNPGKYLNHYNIIYGHFPANRYDALGSIIRRAMFFREPVNRTCSNYFYRLDKHSDGPGDVSHVPIEEFAMRPNMRFLYQNYLAGVDIDKLDYIGITEYFNESIKLYEKIFGVKLKQHSIRLGNKYNYIEYLKEESALNAVVESQKVNQKIYEDALKRFEKLFNQYC